VSAECIQLIPGFAQKTEMSAGCRKLSFGDPPDLCFGRTAGKMVNWNGKANNYSVSLY
jgi:hypothetical protein